MLSTQEEFAIIAPILFSSQASKEGSVLGSVNTNYYEHGSELQPHQLTTNLMIVGSVHGKSRPFTNTAARISQTWESKVARRELTMDGWLSLDQSLWLVPLSDHIVAYQNLS